MSGLRGTQHRGTVYRASRPARDTQPSMCLSIHLSNYLSIYLSESIPAFAHGRRRRGLVVEELSGLYMCSDPRLWEREESSVFIIILLMMTTFTDRCFVAILASSIGTHTPFLMSLK